ncbi:DUF5719 family protein [Nocardioides sambongensis]|uniref:DUF5719 family protein n=1 Tax=Nocardioides sambongensis TaxID=2589074 RepID=UPI001126BDA4|nr:DUF5719 family protein [Nocardioides sambongensis]
MSAPIEQGDQAAVAVLLVSHDGAAWLPSVLEGIRTQSAPIASLVAIDTGSRDGSAELIENACAEAGLAATVVRAPIGTTYPEAVEMGLARLGEAPRPPTWVWLLHDDSRPDPSALQALTTVAAQRPEADFLGPKLREWPSLRRLLELGVTISGTGRRETGLERGEYDQGQHPDVREVLAVNSAGMLARRETLTAVGGFDPHLPMFGNDLDLGWRAAAAGHTTLIVPDAVVFHAEAAHRGVRRTALTGRHTHFQERRAALYTLLANVRPFALPFQLLRIVLGSLLRMLGFLVVRSVGEALDELAALVAVVTRPGVVHAARRERARVVAANRGDAGPDKDRVRRLLAPWWLPYRHGLDFVGDLIAAATNQAADVAERRRAAAAEQNPQQPVRRPADDEDEEYEEYEDSGFVVRFFTNPVAVTLAVVVLALVVGARDAFGDISGGALSPAPSGRGTWWSLHLESWHALGFGTAVPAPGYVLMLAVLGSVFGPGWTMSFLLITAGPLAVWGAWRFLRLVGRLLTPAGAPRWVVAGGAVAYAAVPLAAGAWGSGRWGVIVAAALLPWMAHAALGFADPEPARRWRAAWRSGLVLAVLTALAPVLWWLFLALAVVVLVAAAVLVRATIGQRSVWGPPLAALAVPPVVLAPWWLPAIWHGAGAALFLDIGRWPTPATGGWSLLAGRFGESGAPLWIGLILPVLALLALIPRASRIGVLVCWLVAAVTALVAIPLATSSVDLPGLASQQPGLGAVLLLLHGSWVTAVVLGAVGLRGVELAPWGRGAVALVAAVAVVVPVGGVAWFVVDGGEELTERPATGVPVYMQQRAEAADQDGVLVLRGSVDEGVNYEVVRGDGPTVGEDEITGLTPEDPAVTAEITELITDPSAETVDALNRRGIVYVVLPSPADGEIASRLDASGGSTGPARRTVTPRPGRWHRTRRPTAWRVRARGCGSCCWWSSSPRSRCSSCGPCRRCEGAAHEHLRPASRPPPQHRPAAGRHRDRRAPRRRSPCPDRPPRPGRPPPVGRARRPRPGAARGGARSGRRDRRPGGSGARDPPARDAAADPVHRGVPPAIDNGGRATDVVALRAPGSAGGDVAVRTGDRRLTDAGTRSVGDTPVTIPDSAGSVVLDATGESAPGLVAGRREALAAPTCRALSYDEWYLGLGASARNASVITLVNPDDTPAVVDITLTGPNGPVEEDALRDVPVRAGGTVRLDLAEIAPRRSEVAAHVAVTRGRVSASVAHQWDPLGAGRVTVESLPAQAAPATEGLLLGVDPDAEQGWLHLANPGDDEARVSVRVLTEEAVFAPSSAEDVVVPPLSSLRVPLRSLVDAEAADGMLGLVVESSSPVVSSAHGLVDDDLVAVGAAELLTDPSAVVVPEGEARLYLGGATGTGVVRVTAFDSDGEELLDDERVEIAADRAAVLDLPDGTAALTLATRNAEVAATVRVDTAGSTPGATYVPVQPTVLESEVPVVLPR